jgi:thioredoxin-related protein
MRTLFYLLLLVSINAFASDSTRMYNPYANVEKDMATVMAKAKKENKHVLLQIGNNGCVGCYQLNSFIQREVEIKSFLDSNYVIYHLNYSKENKNLAYMKKLGNPEQFGLPVLVILDADGNKLHTQDINLLLKGNGYDKEKVKNMIVKWSKGIMNDEGI